MAIGMVEVSDRRLPALCGACREPFRRVHYGAQGESFVSCGCTRTKAAELPAIPPADWRALLAGADAAQQRRPSYGRWMAERSA